jgi:hypothetical protein
MNILKKLLRRTFERLHASLGTNGSPEGAKGVKTKNPVLERCVVFLAKAFLFDKKAERGGLMQDKLNSTASPVDP